MGTNYYVTYGPGQLHVGKASAGWVFCFRGYDDGPEFRVATTEDWRKALDGLVRHGPERLLDEYGREFDLDDFWAGVVQRRKLRGVKSAAGGPPHPVYADDEGNDFAMEEFC